MVARAPHIRVPSHLPPSRRNISSAQRATSNRPCPICRGHNRLPRGKRRRCHGFISSDGRYAHCSREEYAGGLPLLEESQTYAHRLDGSCRCEVDHQPKRARSNGPVIRAPITAVYEYHDADGTPLFEVVRRSDKSFYQRRSNGQGGHINNLNGVSVVPYHVDELASAAPGSQVWLPEGEKDVDRLRSLGLLATCNPMGAGKWDKAYSEALRGFHVVLLADNDEAGRRHVEKVARSLQGEAASVRIVELPGLPKGGDVSDFLDQGGTIDELQHLADTSSEWQPREPEGPTVIVIPLSAVTATPVRWLWERWLARAKVHLLGGHPGDGKSTLAASIAATLSVGGTWPDGTVAPFGRTLFLLAEDALDDTLRPRLDALGANSNLVFAIDAVREVDGTERLFSLDRHLPLLERAIAEHGIDVVVIDPLTSFMPRADRNAEGDVRDLLTPLGKLAERTGVAVLCVMHVGKPSGAQRRPLQQLLGATAFGAVARLVWMVAEAPDDVDATRRVLGVVKSNLALKPKALEWSRGEDAGITWHGESAHDIGTVLGGVQPQPRATAEAFLRDRLAEGPVPADTLQEEARIAGISERTLRRAADSLGVQHSKEVGVKDGSWLWYLPTRSEAAPGATDHGSDMGIDEKVATSQGGQVATFSQGKIRPNPSLDEWLLTGKVAIDALDGHLRHPIEGGQVDTFLAGHLPPEAHGPLGSHDSACQWSCIQCGSILPPERKYRCVHCQTQATVTKSGGIT